MSQEDILLSCSRSEELLQAVCSNNLSKIEDIFNENSNLIEYIYPSYNRNIFLIACSEDDVDAKTVQKLLKLGADCRDHRSDNCWEAIHFAANETNFEVLEVLLGHNPECVNAVDKYGNNALHFLLRHGKESTENFMKCVEILLNYGVNVNQPNSKFVTPLDMISKLVHDKDLNETTRNYLSKTFNNMERKENALLRYINEGDENKCIQEIEKIITKKGSQIASIEKRYPPSTSTLLQLCCKNNLCNVVKYMLSKGFDHTTTTGLNPEDPVEIAVKLGYTGIVEALLEKYDDISKIPGKLLILILKNIDNKQLDYIGCYKVLMATIKTFIPIGHQTSPNITSKINECDEVYNTPLHYAVWYASSDIIVELLSLGAFQGAKNKYGDMPIKDIEADTLKIYLDRCVVVSSYINKYEPDFRVKFNIQSLIPPCKINRPQSSQDLESSKILPSTSSEQVSETEVVFLVATSPELKKLLTHPVIVNFLSLKWRQYQWLFWTNFLFYLIFAVSLILYVIMDHCNFRKIAFMNPTIFNISYYCLLFNLILLVFREMFQLITDVIKYFKTLDNYIEIALIGITCLILSGVFRYDVKRPLWSVLILLLSFELITIVGKHPHFSTNIVMLRTVSYNFFYSFLSYSLIIVAFAFSFYLLFNTSTKEIRPDGNTNITEDEGDGLFANIGTSVFKTIVMVTGEFDSSGLDFETYFLISRLIFAFFIFMVHLILLNLLNGLAVNDTKEIRDEAELFGYIARIEYIRTIENMLIGNCLPPRLKRIFRKVCRFFSGAKKLYDETIFDSVSSQIVHSGYELACLPNKKQLFYGPTNNLSNCIKLKINSETKKRIHSIIRKRYKRHGCRYESVRRESNSD